MPENQIRRSRHPYAKMVDDFTRTLSATAGAHQRFLEFSRNLTRFAAENIAAQHRLLGALTTGGPQVNAPPPAVEPPADAVPGRIAFTREQCLTFATGKVSDVLGPDFSEVDNYKTRVRLPDEPLMLVDRIIVVEGIRGSLSGGRVITEHDVNMDAWYLDGGSAPACIAVEAGQADLFLCAYLGIDRAVKGRRVYRLLDAAVVFHRELPRPGETIRYEITIDKFVRQGETYLFFFNFEGTVNGRPLISMSDGCAGFFTPAEIHHSGGIIPKASDAGPKAGRRDPLWSDFVPPAKEHYDDAALEALRAGDLAACFGQEFRRVSLAASLCLPGGRMKLIDRVLELDPRGGRWGIGSIRAEADIHPDDWFLTCHFVDDMTMPGTLMYECCMHALRVYLLRLGWVSERSDVHYEPVPGIKSVLRCRGPVTPQTKQVVYEVEIKEIGYRPEPYAIADAHMHADGRCIVRFKDMSLRMTGLTRETLADFWKDRGTDSAGRRDPRSKPIPFERRQILAFAAGKPSEAFGSAYAVFDDGRFLARLPGPPYSFIDRVVRAEPEFLRLEPDGWIQAEFDVDPQAWYFKANRSNRMPYCVLMEVALQSCGWLAAFAGSALHSRKDLRFRNLDGRAILHKDVMARRTSLKVRCRLQKVSALGDVIIETFAFQVLQARQPVYEGTTVFGFFTADALANQRGIGDIDEAALIQGTENHRPAKPTILADEAPLTPNDTRGSHIGGLAMPAKALRMIDHIDVDLPSGGPHGRGYLCATKVIDPAEWFFDAHFHQDPVCPGSLGIESFLQLLKFAAGRRWKHLVDSHRFAHVCGTQHQWQYRGQILPQNRKVTVEASISSVKETPEPELTADGYLSVDGLRIYRLQNFGLRLVPEYE